MRTFQDGLLHNHRLGKSKALSLSFSSIKHILIILSRFRLRPSFTSPVHEILIAGPTLPTRTQTDVQFKKGSPEDLVSGDMRAIVQPGLASMHTLFHVEHNRIAKQILDFNPG